MSVWVEVCKIRVRFSSGTIDNEIYMNSLCFTLSESVNLSEISGRVGEKSGDSGPHHYD